jgi:hypothetical protein
MSATEWNNITIASTEDDSGTWVEVSASSKKNTKRDTRNKNSSTTNGPNLPNISSNNSTRTNSSVKKDSSELPVVQIREWAASKNPVSKMIQIYDDHKSIWERPRFVQDNLNRILEELSRSRRWDVLMKLMEVNPLFYENLRYLHKGVSPYHKLVWPFDKQGINFNETYYNELIKTFHTLISMGFDVFMDNLNVENEYETFIGALIKPKNPINPEYKTKLYNYFTEECKDYEFNETVVTNILNKCNNKTTLNNNNFETKFNHINDKILFVIQKFGIDFYANNLNNQVINTNDDSNNSDSIDENKIESISSIQAIFNFCCTMLVEPTKRTNKWVENVCLAILSNPRPKQDFYDYLNKRDINEIKNKFIEILISNCEKWIDTYVKNFMKYKNEQEDISDEDFEKQVKQSIINTYSNLMIMFATFYSKSYKKNEIINTIQNIIENILVQYNLSNEERVIIATYFIQNSSININNLSNDEKQLFKYLVNNFYKSEKKFLKAKIQISICIGNITGETSQSNINNLISQLGND